ncbi:hypothetical protein BU14_0288s0003, partial [Porphyra umbilicalis]
MGLPDFIRNNRGINDGADVPPAFLREVFDSIAATEIRMSDEAGIAALTEEHWDETLRVTPSLSLVPATAPSSPAARAADTVLFSSLWPPAVATSLSALATLSPSESSGVQKYIESLVSVARCGSTLRRTAPVDAAVSALAAVTGLREGLLDGATVRFGGSLKAQMAAVALFGATRRRGRGGLATANGFLTAVGGLFGAASGTFRAARAGLADADDVNGGGGDGGGKRAPAGADALPRRPASAGDLTAASAGSSPTAGAWAVDDHSDLELFDENDLSTSESDSSADAPAFGPRARVPGFLRLRGRDALEARALARKCLADGGAAQSLVAEANYLRSEALACFVDALSQSAALAISGRSDGEGEGAAEREPSPAVATAAAAAATTAAVAAAAASARGRDPAAVVAGRASRDSSASSAADVGAVEAEDAAALAALLQLLPLSPPTDCIAVVGDYVPPWTGDDARDAAGAPAGGGGRSTPPADVDSGDYGGAAAGEEDSDTEVSFWAASKRDAAATAEEE